MKTTKHQWWDIYENLSLFGGELAIYSDDSEDMLTITYPNGLMIDVGCYGDNKIYCITIVPADTKDGWQSILAEIKVDNKLNLPVKIQDAILAYRNYEKQT